ncbi:hypothetical protein AURDEDRAFT_113452 [Auricularia subglabra TFB-10046 SS5]|nr:hypothetical protein AURDEDRAFT_113452 [Auricularia subglabra TFB-10046 SS5]
MIYASARSTRSESQTSSVGSLYATAGHSARESPIVDAAWPSSSVGDPAILVVPAPPIAQTGDVPARSARRPPSVASSISTTSTIAAAEEVKDSSIEYEKPLATATPPQTSTTARDIESGAEHPSSRRLAILSAVALVVITVIVVAVVLSLHPSHQGQHLPHHDYLEPPSQEKPPIAGA